MDANQQPFTLRLSGRTAEVISGAGELVGTLRCGTDAAMRSLIRCWSGRRVFSTEQDERAWHTAEKAALSAHRAKLLSNALGAPRR